MARDTPRETSGHSLPTWSGPESAEVGAGPSCCIAGGRDYREPLFASRTATTVLLWTRHRPARQVMSPVPQSASHLSVSTSMLFPSPDCRAIYGKFRKIRGIFCREADLPCDIQLI